MLSLAAYLAPGDATSGTRERLEAVADLLQPGWRAELVAARHLPRQVAVPVVPAPRGVPGGNSPGGRPAAMVPGAPGLALAGDWVGPEGLLVDSALASGAAAARVLRSGRSSPVGAAE